jgi:hypothetical protein
VPDADDMVGDDHPPEEIVEILGLSYEPIIDFRNS